jgi:hypothetical protein
MRIAHFDPVTGASGDMILGALIDAGAPIDAVREGLRTLPVPEFVLEAEEVRHHGLRALRLRIEVPDEKKHRHLPEIVRILRAGRLSPTVTESALRVFDRLAAAEARAHGVPVENVHFHEVGALDAILDIAGAALALELLGVRRVTYSALRLGTGEVDTARRAFLAFDPGQISTTQLDRILKGAHIGRDARTRLGYAFEGQLVASLLERGQARTIRDGLCHLVKQMHHLRSVRLQVLDDFLACEQLRAHPFEVLDRLDLLVQQLDLLGQVLVAIALVVDALAHPPGSAEEDEHCGDR